jgi:CHAT domain-containing protein
MKLLNFIFRFAVIAVVVFSSSPANSAATGAASEQGLAEAEQVYRRDGPEAALPLFEKLAIDFHSSDEKRLEAKAIGLVGEIHWRLGNYEQAGEYLGDALAMKRTAGDRLQEGKTLNVLGLLQWDLGDFNQAKDYFRQGFAVANELGDNRLAGAVLNNLSLIHDEQGDYYVSLEQYEQVLKLYDGADFARGEGDTRGNIGGVYLLLGRFREALENYQQALAISVELNSVISMSQDHGNIGLCYMGLGKANLALEHFDQAIALAEQAGMQQDQAYWLRARGNAQISIGRHDIGLQNHRAGLAIYEQLGSETELVEALHDMGRLLGDSGNSERYYRQAMEVARKIGSSRGITGSLLALGDLQQKHGDFEAAESLFLQGTGRAKESAEMATWARGLLRLAGLHRTRENYSAATSEANQALQIAGETGAVSIEIQAMYALAEIDRLQGKLENATAGYSRVIDRLSIAPDTELAWQAHYGKGLALAEAGEKDAAIAALQAAIGLIEAVRENLQQERFRAGYVQDKYQVYLDLVRLQLETGQDQEAFSTAERLRSRSYFDLIESGTQPGPGLQDESTAFALRERIRVLRKALLEENSQVQPNQRQVAISVYSQELLNAEQDYQAFLDESRRASKFDRYSGQAPTYADIKAKLAPNEALVEYVVGDEQLMLFILTRSELAAETVPLRRTDLVNKVELIRNLIRRQDNNRWEKPAVSLAASLLAPILDNGGFDGIEHLYLVPHGSLNYLPFSLLPVNGNKGSSLLIEEYTLAYLPTAAALLRDYSNSNTVGSMLTISPARSLLSHAGAEAEAVNALFAPDSLALVGKSATESTFKHEAANYRLLHLATHGYFNKFNPLLSGLELEADAVNDGQLELHEILGLKLDADLVTLSACQTALGSGHFAEIPAGDDFVGLTRAFLYAGSAAVMATLWEVDDASTLELMKTFYGGSCLQIAINIHIFGLHLFSWARWAGINTNRSDRTGDSHD